MSTIKANTLTVKCGSTLTLGESGKTVTIASGASTSGMGRTGTVDWQTGSIKTGDFTAVNTQGFFVDTNGGAVEATLPAGSAGAIISFQDYRNTFDTNNLKVTPNGSEKINGGAGSVVLSTEGEGITLVYIDSTIGWRSIQDNDFSSVGSNFIIATGGTETTVCTNFKVHTFTSPGTFSITSAGIPANAKVDYLVVAGGGGGGSNDGGGGGGAGGYRESGGTTTGCYTVSPLGSSPSAVVALPVSTGSIPVTVGAGGTPTTCSANGPGGSGSNSIFSTITSTGGGGGAQFNMPVPTGGGPKSGGSGGGGGGRAGNTGTCGAAGNTPPVSPPQGTNGGNATPGTSPGSIDAGGGGGGATGAGANGQPNGPGGLGGAGATSSINGTPTARSGGGGGGSESGAGGAGGTGGGGAGSGPGPAVGTAGTTNTGGGGGGVSTGNVASGAGGSGIVIIRYRFQ